MQFQTQPTTAWHRHIAAIARYIPDTLFRGLDRQAQNRSGEGAS